MLERVQHGAAGREEAKWQKFPPEQRAHEAQHCVHHKSRSVVLIPSNLISPRGSALICQEFFWCRKPPPVHGGSEGRKEKKKKKKPPYCFCADEDEDIFFFRLLSACHGAGSFDCTDLYQRLCVIPGTFSVITKQSSSYCNVIPSLTAFTVSPSFGNKHKEQLSEGITDKLHGIQLCPRPIWADI